ncbi:DUF3164 family protein [Sphingomonas sp. Ag1]|jgi:hypothetical protein|uniref:DUF3164 family protein n=1 Tax=Sphingomonas sp. Ag1 TaxID=1642949 RepID=UPI0006228B8C|nr:DUF3164 family protein [Sphingomonas sp. Ag1]KKI17488.1 sulfate transporter [Sphingomonas sp. Ag1]
MTDASHPAAVHVGDALYLRDAKGSLVPIEAVKPVDLLMDESVRGIIGRATAASDTVRMFKRETFSTITALQELIAQQYGTTLGGKKGNITLTSFDGCMKVQLQVADLIEFGPELQAAKLLIDECLAEWSADSGAEMRALVNRVFQVDKQGQINRAELFMLMRVESADERWNRAISAIRESIRVIGSREYVRFYERPTPDAAWRPISIDLATV